jgi:mono/diheme cytochrome c family protein
MLHASKEPAARDVRNIAAAKPPDLAQERRFVNRPMSLLAVCAVAAFGATSCSKSASSDSATAAATGTANSGSNPSGTIAGNATHGQDIYRDNCAGCHGVAGAGGIGPSLKGERRRKDDAAAIAWIKDPQSNVMPKLFPAQLSESDVEDVAAYVESL